MPAQRPDRICAPRRAYARSAACAVLAVGLLGAGRAAAQAAFDRSPWSLTINGIERGEVIAAREGEAVWIPVETIMRAGVTRIGGEQRDLFGAPHVRLQSLAPSVTFTFDEDQIALTLTVAPELLTPTVIEIQRPYPPGIEYSHSPSAFVNYALAWDTVSGMSYLGQAAVSFAGQSLYSDFSFDDAGVFYRGLTTLTLDARRHRVRAQAGDVYGRGGLLASAPLVAGFSIGREYGTDPYFQSYASPVFRGSVVQPSLLDLYVNGELARQLQLPPGPYSIGRLPLTNGLGRVRIDVRDPSGRVQSIQSRYYLMNTALVRGEQDFTYLAGFVRHDGDRVTYDDTLTASATHRVGVTNAITLGYHAEGDRTTLNGGPTVNLRLWLLGEIEGAAAYSRAKNGDRGWAASGSYFWSTRPLSVSLSGRYTTPLYSDVAVAADEAKDPWSYKASLTFPIGHAASLGAEMAREEVVEVDLSAATPPAARRLVPQAAPVAGPAERVKRQTLFGALRLHSRASLNANLSREERQGKPAPEWRAYAALTLTVGGRTSLNVSAQYADRLTTGFVDLNRPLPRGPGVGYRIAGDGDGDGTGRASAELQAQGRMLWAGVRQDRTADGTSTTALALAGAVAWVGGTVAFSRVLENSFAFVRVPASPGVQVFLDNDNVGRTGPRGTLLIPDLLPYWGNAIRIADADLPLDFSIEQVARTIAPPYRGGAAITFPVTRLRAWLGTVTVETAQGSIVPAFGTLAITGPLGMVQSPLGGDGAFYVDGIAPGSYPATVTYKGGTCTFTIELPDSPRALSPLGTLVCREGVER